jgi:hypothetical protein
MEVIFPRPFKRTGARFSEGVSALSVEATFLGLAQPISATAKKAAKTVSQ